MATTTNYSWNTPDNTAYVKDGASAIRTLGSSVDTTLFTALGGAYPGLRLIKTQTVGTGVSSVSVSSAFSATYQNYKILYSNGVASGTIDLLLSLNGITTGYWSSLIYSGFNSVGIAAAKAENAGNFSWTGCATTANTLVEIEIQNPFLAKTKMMNATYNTMNVPTGNIGRTHGFINSTTSATAFTLTTNTGTITGGTIYVYGYGAS
jgi:hypothetical protein